MKTTRRGYPTVHVTVVVTDGQHDGRFYVKDRDHV